MSLIPCRECGEMISDKAVSCPKCGYPMESSQEENEAACEDKDSVTKEDKPKMTKEDIIRVCVVVAILLVFGIGILWAIISSVSEQKRREQSTIRAMKGISKDLGEITEQYNKEVESIMEDIKRDEAERKSK